mgnify:CR=1 FL=1
MADDVAGYPCPRGAGQWQQITYNQAIFEIASALGSLRSNNEPEKLVWFAEDNNFIPIQESFWEKHGLQCGFCTPGFVMSLFALYQSERRGAVQYVFGLANGNYDVTLKFAEGATEDAVTVSEDELGGMLGADLGDPVRLLAAQHEHALEGVLDLGEVEAEMEIETVVLAGQYRAAQVRQRMARAPEAAEEVHAHHRLVPAEIGHFLESGVARDADRSRSTPAPRGRGTDSSRS